MNWSSFWLCVVALLAACGGAPPPVCSCPAGPAPLAIATPETPPSPPGAAAFSAWSDAESPIPTDSQDPMWGNRTAPVTIVLFSDFQCPFCARVATTLERIKQTYGKDAVRLIWKNEPLAFHPNAKPAAEAAMGVFAVAGAEAFWKFHDLAFAGQSALGTESYLSWARQAGVEDAVKFKSDLEAHVWAAKVEADMALATKVGANGTPHCLINGVDVSGAQPFDKFKEVIDAELAKARAAVAAGTSPDRVYVEMSKQNKVNPPPPPKAEPADDDRTVWLVPVGASPVRGPDTALVTIVEFSDFQCPYCKRVEETLAKVRSTYGDKVRIVWKNEPLPFHGRAEPAAELAVYAWKQKGNPGFWAAHDKLFDAQPNLDDGDLVAIAKALGLDARGAQQAIEAHKYRALIGADADLADDLNASGTPHFFINGRRLVGAQPFEKFQALIDEELESAKKRVAHGTPPQGVYAEIMKTAKEAIAPEKKAAPLPSYPLPSKGSLKAKIVIQEFSDFQCPFCARVQPTIKDVLAGYGDRVRLVFRHKPLPMHPAAPLAAEAAMEAFHQKGSDGFFKMHDLLFKNQSADGLGQDALESYAAEIGLDRSAFRSALERRVHRARVEAETRAADDAGITGTPAFIINGYFVSGAQPAAKFRKVIDRALSEK